MDELGSLYLPNLAIIPDYVFSSVAQEFIIPCSLNQADITMHLGDHLVSRGNRTFPSKLESKDIHSLG